MDKIFTVKEVADIFQVTEYTVREWLKDEKLVGFKIPGHQWRINEAEVRKFANQQYGEASA